MPRRARLSPFAGRHASHQVPRVPSLESLLRALASPVADLASPESRHYGPALLVALGAAAVVWWRSFRRVPLGRFLFGPKVWLHRSAKLDYQLLFARPVVRATLLAPFVVSATFIATRVALALRGWLGTGPLQSSSPVLAVALFSVSAFVVEDFVRFAMHVASHRVPALWALHRLHHTAEVLTPFSVHRVHPLESLVNRTAVAVAVGFVAGVCAWLFAHPVSGWTILGVDALGFLWNLVAGPLRHSGVPLRFPRWLEHLFVSPAQHQIHHGDRPEQYHRNYGSALAIWDWAYGTLVTSEAREHVRFGLPPALKNHGDDALSALVMPVASMLGALVPAKLRGRAVRLARSE